MVQLQPKTQGKQQRHRRKLKARKAREKQRLLQISDTCGALAQRLLLQPPGGLDAPLDGKALIVIAQTASWPSKAAAPALSAATAASKAAAVAAERAAAAAVAAGKAAQQAAAAAAAATKAAKAAAAVACEAMGGAHA